MERVVHGIIHLEAQLGEIYHKHNEGNNDVSEWSALEANSFYNKARDGRAEKATQVKWGEP